MNILSASVQTTGDRWPSAASASKWATPSTLGDVLRAVRNIDGVYDVYRVTN